MKNKKSKIVVPALALILLSTAASISGSVAWFTANRTANIKTGEFAVVKTGDKLDFQLGAVAGIQTPAANADTVVAIENYKLTDASFDHTWHNKNSESGFEDWTLPYVVNPNVPKTQVLSTASLSLGSAALTNALNRGTNVYSAFVWTITLNVTFSDASTANQGLFLDLQSQDTYMNGGAVEIAVNDPIPNGLYRDAKCTDGPTADEPNATAQTAGTYYKKPASTGKGFRIAFIPTSIPANSVGYAKVWAGNETGAPNEGRFVSGHGFIEGENEDPDIPATVITAGTNAYSRATLKNAGGTYSSVDTGTAAVNETPAIQKTYMNGSCTDTVPADNEKTDTQALQQNANYLGYFGVSAGNTVSLTYTCVAWYEGTHPLMIDSETLEAITTSMSFSVCNLN